MKSRSGWLTIAALLLAAAYVAFFTDWFKSEPIRLSCRFFPLERGNPAAGKRAVFYMVPKQPISILQVLPAAEANTAKPTLLWHMVSSSKPVPVEAFDYGEPVPGMKPFVSGIAPAPLLPGGEYLVRVEIGKKRGELKFTVPTE